MLIGVLQQATRPVSYHSMRQMQLENLSFRNLRISSYSIAVHSFVSILSTAKDREIQMSLCINYYTEHREEPI